MGIETTRSIIMVNNIVKYGVYVNPEVSPGLRRLNPAA